MIAVGIMSGTSADGIDVAVVELDVPASVVQLHVSMHKPYAANTRRTILEIGEGKPTSAHELARLHGAVADAYVVAVTDCLAGWDHAGSRPPSVIAMHGQTVAHLPTERATLQLGDAARIAIATSIPTIADFRSADIAAGGQGAPLAPFADQILFSRFAPVAILNIGGIANLTIIPSAQADSVIAFDTGPGNMVIDAIAEMSAGEAFDRDGAAARRGTVSATALKTAMSHPYFARRAPKSTGREEFGKAFAGDLAEHVLKSGGTWDDAIATATELTATSIAEAVTRETPSYAKLGKLLVAGGGARNPTLMKALGVALAPLPVETTDAYGVPTDMREAMAFAILGAYRLRQLPNTLPRTTGASRAVCAGALHLP